MKKEKIKQWFLRTRFNIKDTILNKEYIRTKLRNIKNGIAFDLKWAYEMRAAPIGRKAKAKFNYIRFKVLNKLIGKMYKRINRWKETSKKSLEIYQKIHGLEI